MEPEAIEAGRVIALVVLAVAIPLLVLVGRALWKAGGENDVIAGLLLLVLVLCGCLLLGGGA